ncbi:hypothetical protein ASD81_06600 [Nocardioides sp. Root614]|nr:hypothetical protein ASD81_06600 [Nocardioides sp. Root614]KRA92264.1 hypothetical protein ASD84_06865 [Nocardioides sp. Root682]
MAFVAIVLGGCGSASEPSPPTGVDGLEIPTPGLTASDFVPRIDNRWLPLVPGTEWVYQATSSEGEETITVTVLDETRKIGGVTATVVHDVVTDADGELVEDTFDWFAQDTAGNVWYLGEATTEYDDGETSTEGSWEAGVDGAEAGLAMAAEPRIGDGYKMEYLRGEAEDQAAVLGLDATATVPFGSFDGLLETEDTTPLEPGLVEHKLYAEGTGLIREETVEGGDEVVVLVSFTQK